MLMQANFPFAFRSASLTETLLENRRTQSRQTAHFPASELLSEPERGKNPMLQFGSPAKILSKS
jgi:hypothetical protein